MLSDLFEKLSITEYKKIDKGRINKNFVCKISNETYFLKTNDYNNNNNNMFEYERRNLLLLKNLNINVPNIISYDKNYLLLEYLDNDLNHDLNHLNMLAETLAKLHNIKSDQFGHEWNSFSAMNEVHNTCNNLNDYIDFFKNTRWQPLINSLHQFDIKKYYNMWILGTKIADLMRTIFVSPIKPSLLHGDMNIDNFIISNGKCYLFDVNSYYGHTLYDIACLTCWNTDIDFTSFIDTYNSHIDSDNEHIDIINQDTQLMLNVYYAYIYLTSYLMLVQKNQPQKRYLTKSQEYMNIIINTLLIKSPNQICYPSLIQPFRNININEDFFEINEYIF